MIDVAGHRIGTMEVESAAPGWIAKAHDLTWVSHWLKVPECRPSKERSRGS